MMDKLTIMSWLEGLAQDDWRECHSDSEVQEIARQTLALLKEQEPKHVKVKEQIFSIKRGYCPNCGIEMFNDTYPHWCGNCGQEVIWDD